LFISARDVSPFTGEGASIQFHKNFLETEYACTILDPPRANLWAVRRLLRDAPDMPVLWFLPTLAQVPLASVLMRGLPNPGGIYVEGAPLLRHGDWRQAVFRMPAFFLARALLTREIVARVAEFGRPLPVAMASRWQADRARRVLGGWGVYEIPNGSPGMPLRALWRGGKGRSLSVLGHGLYYKGADLVLAVAERLRRRIPGLTVDWAWNGMRTRLLRLAGARDWVGLYDRVDPYEFLTEGALVLVPLRVSSGTNVFPNVLIEAMSVGAPLVTSDLPCHRELLGAAADVAIVRGYSVDAWSERVERLLLSRSEREGLGEALLRRSQSIWHRQALRGRWDSFLEAMFVGGSA
jgi:glycosyltransferase involved in cell wall biosynthesis